MRYGNKPLQLARGKTAIVVGKNNKPVAVIERLIEEVKAKEANEVLERDQFGSQAVEESSLVIFYVATVFFHLALCSSRYLRAASTPPFL